MPNTSSCDAGKARSVFWLRIIEPTLIVAMILFLALGWFVALRYQGTMENVVTHSYQETQLQIVQAVARSAAFFVQRELAQGAPITEIEQDLLNRFVAPVQLLDNGDAWIYAPDHVVFDRSSDFPEQYKGKSMAEIFATQTHLGAYHYEEMTSAVTEAREGVGWYVWLPEKGREIAAWTPVRIESHVWTIGLSTPLSEILVATGAQKQRRFIMAIMAGTSLIGLAMVSLALWGMNRRRLLDGRLRRSHAELSRSVEELEREIAKRQKAEEERHRLNEQLMQAQKMEAIGAMAGGVAHDLNNILAGLVSYPQLLLTTLPPDSSLYNPIQTIQHSGQRAAAIVQDLLTLSRRSRRNMEIVDLNRIIGDYLASPEHGRLMLDHPTIGVETTLQPDLLPIRGEPVSLTKTLMNLVFNAFEAMRGMVGPIRISAENCYVDQRLKGTVDVAEGDYVRISVIDGGKGICPQDQARIFEPFYSRKVLGRSGTGLGLAVVWNVVQDHQGVVNVQSVEGKGARFDLYFPATREKVTTEVSQTFLPSDRGRGETILVVDDVALQRQVACEMLTRLGYSATTVDSGEEALEFSARQSVDLVVLDMIMEPGIDGLETYRRMLQLHPAQKAIVASGFSENDRVREILSLGAGAYLRKPYLMEQLGLAIRRELDRKPGACPEATAAPKPHPPPAGA